MDVLQIDHTPVDVIVVDKETRRSIGRPWLTLAIDVATRMVAGFHVSLWAPSALSVSLTLSQDQHVLGGRLVGHYLYRNPAIRLPPAN